MIEFKQRKVRFNVEVIVSYNAVDIAKYFISLDTDGTVFSKDKLIERNGSTMYEGNLKLNKFLHLAQNLYIAKYGKLLFDNNMYAYKNGAIVKDVQSNYLSLFLNLNHAEIDDETEEFLKLVYRINRNAPIDELIEISHEDPEWEDKECLPNGKQLMDSLSRINEYKNQYEDALYIMEKMRTYEQN